MHDKYLDAFSRALDIYSSHFMGDPAIRRLRVFLHIAENGPETAKEIAAYFRAAEPTIRDDIRALGKIGVAKQTGLRLIDEIQPVTPGRPHHYRLSKKGQKVVDSASYAAYVAIMPDEGEEENREFLSMIEHTRC